jgi:regulator of protease activity HflC (stomatin/prohibitin superfamily)
LATFLLVIISNLKALSAMKKVLKPLSLALLFIFSVTSCVTVRQGNVGVKRTIGKIHDNSLPAGPRWYNPFVSKIIIVPVNTQNLEVSLPLPSKEGLNVETQISILYHVDEAKATDIIGTIGPDYLNTIILPVFRAAAADVTAKFMAKDMHTGNRLDIENAIKAKMMQLIGDRGFVIEAVLLKSVNLPSGLYRAIEEKLQAEQEAQRMEFVLQKERQEAERKKIEAGGVRDANQIISEGLTPAIIQYKSLEVYKDLSQSPNAKVIIGGSEPSVLVQP